jgi:hypothetical protein
MKYRKGKNRNLKRCTNGELEKEECADDRCGRHPDYAQEREISTVKCVEGGACSARCVLGQVDLAGLAGACGLYGDCGSYATGDGACDEEALAVVGFNLGAVAGGNGH